MSLETSNVFAESSKTALLRNDIFLLFVLDNWKKSWELSIFSPWLRLNARASTNSECLRKKASFFLAHTLTLVWLCKSTAYANQSAFVCAWHTTQYTDCSHKHTFTYTKKQIYIHELNLKYKKMVLTLISFYSVIMAIQFTVKKTTF